MLCESCPMFSTASKQGKCPLSKRSNIRETTQECKEHRVVRVLCEEIRRLRNKCDRRACKGCIQITNGMRGFFAVLLRPDESKSFCEPWNSGIGSYKSSKDAEPEAKGWAEEEGLQFKQFR